MEPSEKHTCYDDDDDEHDDCYEDDGDDDEDDKDRDVHSVTAQPLCNILEQAYLCTIILRSHWSCLYNLHV